MNASRQDEGGPVMRVLASFSGIAAAILGLLYLAGVLVKASELHSAGLDGHDMLPLFPLEQMLRTGLTFVAPGLALLAAGAVFLGGHYLLERRLQVLAARFREERLPQIADAQSEEWESKYREAEEKTDWDLVMKEIGAAREAAADRKERRRLRRLHSRFVGATVLVVLTFAGLGGALIALFPLPIVGVVYLLILVVAVAQGKQARPAERMLIPYYGLLVAGLIASTLIYPQPLARGEVLTKNEGLIEGGVVVIDGGTWYLRTDEGEVRHIPAEQVACSRLTTPPHERDRLQDLLEDPVEPARPPLDCDTDEPATASGG